LAGNRLIHRTSVIFLSSENGTEVYRSADDVPPRQRRKMKRAISTRQAHTFWIADEKGREELERSARQAFRQNLESLPASKETAEFGSSPLRALPAVTFPPRMPEYAWKLLILCGLALLVAAAWAVRHGIAR
jgi:hypothetical protein